MPLVTFEWRCDVCRGPIADGRGYITCDRGAAMVAKRIWRKQETSRRSDGGLVLIDMGATCDLMDRYPPVRWEVLHRRCDPHPGRDNDYWFDVAQARTLDQMLDWNAHLAQKDWLPYTRWFRWLQYNLSAKGMQQ